MVRLIAAGWKRWCLFADPLAALYSANNQHRRDLSHRNDSGPKGLDKSGLEQSGVLRFVPHTRQPLQEGAGADVLVVDSERLHRDFLQ